MSGPIGELEDVFLRAGADEQLAKAMAELIAPKVYWRENFEHIGWLIAETGDVLRRTDYQPKDEDEAIFRRRTVDTGYGTGSLNIRISVD